MKRWVKRTIIGSLSTLAVVLVVAYVFLSAVLSGMCGNEIFAETASPDKNHKAILFQRGCGATTGFSTQISILNSSDVLKNEDGNILTADNHPDVNRFEIEWINSNTLLISNTNAVHTFRKENMLGQITVKYE